MQVDLHSPLLCQFRGQLAVVVVRVGQQDRLHGAIPHVVDYRLRVVRRIHHDALVIVDQQVDVVIHVPLAAVQAELAGGFELLDLRVFQLVLAHASSSNSRA